MRYFKIIIFLIVPVAGCVSDYLPELTENDELLVVEGLITDQPGENTINIYRTLAIWTKDWRTPLKKCKVWITDDLDNSDTLRQVVVGTYVTDSATFIGIPGRKYTLHFTSLEADGMRNYESIPMKMKPVPPIDSIYYEKRDYTYSYLPYEGCQIYLDTHDQEDSCNFYRWKYEETWEFRIPFPDVINRICWGYEKSTQILIKNTSFLESDKVVRFPLRLIKNPVDRLEVRYSILVNQYSLNEDEYDYWQRLQNSLLQVGGLYDIIPSSIPGNVYCREDKLEKVLGYFSVSSVKSKRYFITDHFKGWNTMYLDCADSVYRGPEHIEGNGVNWWVIYDFSDSVPPSTVLTNKRICGDCTGRGTSVRPDFW